MTVKNVTEKKKSSKAELDFIVPVKSTTTIAGGKKEKKKKKCKKSQRIYRIIQNIRIINIFLESLLSESFPSLGVTVHSPPSDALQLCDGLWTCCGAAQILLWFYSCVFLPPVSTPIRTGVFSFVGALSVLFHIP